jgi:anti-sigma-K factor RskA
MNPPSALTDDERHALAGEYVLGTLGSDARRTVEQQMASDPLLERAVQQWQDRLLPLSALAEPITPPPRLWARVEASLRLQPAVPWWEKSWLSLPLWRALASTGIAAAVWMATLLVQQPQPAAPQFLVVLVAPQDKAPGWVIQATDTRHVSLIPLGVFDVPKGKSLQFWTKADSWKGPVSLGLVQPGQRVQIPLDALPALQPNQLFELTLEPANGSPLNRPTGPVQFIGRAVPVL